MTLAQLRYLIAIVDAGLNITLAAERVHATQPGLSKQLRQLESELGFQLIKRRGKSLEAITPEGLEVVERARAIVDEAARIRALATTMRRDNGGTLTIATSHTQARFVLPGYIAALKQEIPALTVRVNPCGRDEEVRDGRRIERPVRAEHGAYGVERLPEQAVGEHDAPAARALEPAPFDE